jgi:hypothetical protein
MSMSLQGAEIRVLILITLAMCAASSTQSSTPPFALMLEAEGNPVKAGSEVKVDITLSNSSNRAMHVSYGLTESDYAFEVRDSQNRIPPETEFARKSKGRGYFSSDHLFYLQPGESLPKAPLVVSKFYDFSRPGGSGTASAPHNDFDSLFFWSGHIFDFDFCPSHSSGRSSTFLSLLPFSR